MILDRRVSEFILTELQPKLDALDIPRDEVVGDFDLIGSGLLDSISFIELVGSVEQKFSIEVNFENWDPEEFTLIDGFIACVVESANPT